MLSLLTSCTSNDNVSSTSISKEKISSVLNEKNYETQKLKYSLLNKDEKFSIWNNKITSLISNGNLNENQISFLEDLKSNLNPNLFDECKKSDSREVFKVVKSLEYINKAKKLFSTQVINETFYQITSTTPTNGLMDDGSSRMCNCSTGSSVTCALGGTVDMPIYCAKSKCNITPSNCGWLLMYDCNGVCKSY